MTTLEVNEEDCRDKLYLLEEWRDQDILIEAFIMKKMASKYNIKMFTQNQKRSS